MLSVSISKSTPQLIYDPISSIISLPTDAEKVKSTDNAETSDLSDDSEPNEDEEEQDKKSEDEWIEAGKSPNQPGIEFINLFC